MHFEGGFCGKYFAFAANKDGEAVFQIVDAQEAVLLGAPINASHPKNAPSPSSHLIPDKSLHHLHLY